MSSLFHEKQQEKLIWYPCLPWKSSWVKMQVHGDKLYSLYNVQETRVSFLPLPNKSMLLHFPLSPYRVFNIHIIPAICSRLPGYFALNLRVTLAFTY